jgi:hypothetical protein
MSQTQTTTALGAGEAATFTVFPALGGVAGALTIVGSTAGTVTYDFVLDELVPTP